MSKPNLLAAQVDPTAISKNGDGRIQGTMQGAIYTGDWIEQAIRAGYGWSVTVGTLNTGGSGMGLITGGGAGTCIDQDQPELAIGLGSGLLVPIRIGVTTHSDIDAADDDADILITVDTAANGMASAPTGTLETPANMLDGAGGSCSAVVYSAITADITDPTVSQILDYSNRHSDGSNVDSHELKLVYEPLRPKRFAGPCTIYVYWGGVAACTGLCVADFLVLPTSWMPTS